MLAARAAEHFARVPTNEAGNGSLMRTAPIALAHLGDDDAMAVSALAVSLLTHGDPLAGEACVLWCVGIDRAVREGRLDGVVDGLELLASASRDRWARHREEARTLSPSTFSPNGFVVSALQAAYAAVHHTEVPSGPGAPAQLQLALERAVQIGNDTDTVAAIAGQFLGARWGDSAIPSHWRNLLHGWLG